MASFSRPMATMMATGSDLLKRTARFERRQARDRDEAARRLAEEATIDWPATSEPFVGRRFIEMDAADPAVWCRSRPSV